MPVIRITQKKLVTYEVAPIPAKRTIKKGKRTITLFKLKVPKLSDEDIAFRTETLKKERSTKLEDLTPSRKISWSNPNDVAEMTKGSCLRPDIYLNGNRCCDECHLYAKGCACEIRKLKHKLVAPEPPAALQKLSGKKPTIVIKAAGKPVTPAPKPIIRIKIKGK